MNPLIKIFLLIAILGGLSLPVSANSCRTDFNPIALNETYSVGVVAKLKSKSNFIFSNKYTLEVISSYKGSASKEIIVRSKKSESACGMKFEKNSTYIVFAYVKDGDLWVSNMSSWPIDEQHLKYTDAVQKFYAEQKAK